LAVVIKDAAYVLASVPDFIRYGSKPARDIAGNNVLWDDIKSHLRTYRDIVGYPPHQVFIGNLNPEKLNDIPKPWYKNLDPKASRWGPFGEIMPQEELYGWMKAADDFNLLGLDPHFIDQIRDGFSAHPLIEEGISVKLNSDTPQETIAKIIQDGAAVPMYHCGKLIGFFRSDHDLDDTLKPVVLMENLVAKASGALAMLHLFKRAQIKPTDVDFVLDCTETAVGDRYNRGGGSLSKAMAEMCGCLNATGHDVRAFCCAPNHAMITAASMVEAGVFEKVVVAGGGCLAKVGMKYAAHLKHGMPILEDVIGAIAFLITKDDHVSPVLRLDAFGKHHVGAGSSQQSIMTSLILAPLARLGLKMTEIDKYATEMHNPEITLPAGSGDTPYTNYRLIASLAALNNQIDKTDIDRFIKERGMPGFCPTQGHVPSAVPFIGHALERIKNGEIRRSMFVAKGSLFLGRMSRLSDGISFMLEKNPNNSNT
jgi:hypothetical protein